MTHFTISEPVQHSAKLAQKIWSPAHPLWQLGFRPFYLLAAIFAALAIPLWIASYLGAGWAALGLNWHMHEMVFGMAIAVIIGFLYTAAKNWTGLWTPRGSTLAALAALWLAGRIAMLIAPAPLAAIIDGLFLPLAAWPLYRVLRESGNTRNLFLVALLGVLACANLAFHAAAAGWLPVAPMRAVQVGILVIVVIESVIGTRVIPMFTRNGAPGVVPVVNPQRDRVILALLVAAGLAWVVSLPVWLAVTLALSAALGLLMRLAAWQAHRTLSVPLLWILHLSYAWIPVGFILLALSELDLVPVSAAFHALTVGSMAGLILGMMTRTALGHTGRKLIAGRAEVLIYLMIQFGALTRLVAALSTYPLLREIMLIAATVCWSGGFLLYAFTYWPYLLRARVDGTEG